MYRQDNRTQEEFKTDIKVAHKIEAEIVLRLCIFHYETTGKWPTLTTLGTDFTGELVDDYKVSADADFKINNTKVEITKSNTVCNRTFHEKVGKVDRCIKGQFSMVFVNGFQTLKEPNFVIITPKMMEELTKTAVSKYGVVRMPARNRGILQKPAYRYDISSFDNHWAVLPQLPSKLPSQYNSILKVAKCH